MKSAGYRNRIRRIRKTHISMIAESRKNNQWRLYDNIFVAHLLHFRRVSKICFDRFESFRVLYHHFSFFSTPFIIPSSPLHLRQTLSLLLDCIQRTIIHRTLLFRADSRTYTQTHIHAHMWLLIPIIHSTRSLISDHQLPNTAAHT